MFARIFVVFKKCQLIEDGYVMKMGNIATKPIKRLGCVLLNFTSRKIVCLDIVFYVPHIRKNLLSEIVLNKCGYKQALQA